jgi:hypothetical protein
MEWTGIVCPRCRRARAMRGTHTCACGQRFKLPKAGRLTIIPEEDEATLFYLPEERRLCAPSEILSELGGGTAGIHGTNVVQITV